MCVGFAVDEIGLPSPKFHEYVGEPVVVFTNAAASDPHPSTVAVLKFTIGHGETVTEIVVSSEQFAVDAVSVTLYVPANAYKCAPVVVEEFPSP